MTPETAAEIRTLVWPKRLRSAYDEWPLYYTTCPCQGGSSGHCQGGRHTKCTNFRGPVPIAETYIFRKNLDIARMPPDGRHAQVFLADRFCSWQCDCGCHRPGWGGDAPPVGQLDLFALLPAGGS